MPYHDLDKSRQLAVNDTDTTMYIHNNILRIIHKDLTINNLKYFFDKDGVEIDHNFQQ